MPVSESPITVHLEKLPRLDDLASHWRDLEGRARPSFFLTWSWIGNWLATLGDHARTGMLLSARHGGRLVGLAVLFDAPIRRRLLPFGRAVHVNETGIDTFDALYIEYNGFLVDAGNVAAVQQAMLDHICSSDAGWREVRLRHAGVGLAVPMPGLSGRVRHHAEQREYCLIDLARVRARGGDYLGMLSAGRRAHIRRCLRAYGAIGPLQLSVAEDLPTALAYFDRLVELHDRRWAQRGRRSDFTSPFCRAFHLRTMADALPRGQVQLLRVSVGERELGYLYSFVHDGQVCFYQSGYDYEFLDPRFSPGLVTLVLAIQHNAALGMKAFDFLAGDQAYKSSLGTDRATMTSWTFQRRSWLSSAERLLRWKWNLLRRIRNGWRNAARGGNGMRTLATVLCVAAFAAAATEFLDPDTGEMLLMLKNLGRSN